MLSSPNTSSVISFTQGPSKHRIAPSTQSTIRCKHNIQKVDHLTSSALPISPFLGFSLQPVNHNIHATPATSVSCGTTAKQTTPLLFINQPLLYLCFLPDPPIGIRHVLFPHLTCILDNSLPWANRNRTRVSLKLVRAEIFPTL